MDNDSAESRMAREIMRLRQQLLDASHAGEEQRHKIHILEQQQGVYEEQAAKHRREQQSLYEAYEESSNLLNQVTSTVYTMLDQSKLPKDIFVGVSLMKHPQIGNHVLESAELIQKLFAIHSNNMKTIARIPVGWNAIAAIDAEVRFIQFVANLHTSFIQTVGQILQTEVEIRKAQIGK